MFEDNFIQKSSNTFRSARSDRPKTVIIKNERREIEKGIIGLNIELSKMNEDVNSTIQQINREIEELKSDFYDFRDENREEILKVKEEIHNRFTEFKGHINEILLEYKESILVIQSYVDSQLIVSKRDRIDMNIVLDSLLKKVKFHDEVSRNYYESMNEISDLLSSLIEILNINYHLQVQDEKDRESIALMGLTQNTSAIDYKKNSEVPPISIDKN